MSRLFEENFENYGSDESRMLEGIWSAVAFSTLEIPSFELDGRYWYKSDGNSVSGARVALPSEVSGVGLFMQVRLPGLPSGPTRIAPIEFANASNDTILRIYVTATGELSLRNDDNTQIAITTSQPIKPGTTHKVQMQAVFGAGTGTCEIRVDDVVVMDVATLDLPGTAAIFRIGQSSQFEPFYIKSIAIYSLTGTYNSDWPNIDGVVTLYPNADTVDDGFTPRPRQLFGAANMYFDNTGDTLDCGISTDFNLGSDDYTLEGWVRFIQRPTGTAIADMWNKWSASTSQRSYRLALYGPDVEGGGLVFERTTDGTLSTRTVLHRVNWTPDIGRWYHIAVCRASGENRIFIDGVQQGLEVPDSATYFAANAKFCVGGEISGTGSSVLANASLNGSVDEIRMTPGVARYTANFTRPSAAFPRSVVDGDPDFADVVLLAGFDEAVEDESSFGRTLTTRGNAARQEWGDAAAEYLTINPSAPIDDRFLEGALLPAEGVLTLVTNPLNAETVTLGATTYTFNTVLGAANSVLIGADVEASLANLEAAINGGVGEGTVYGTGTVANTSATAEAAKPTVSDLTATAITPGVAGNSITSTETLTDGAWSAATLLGGVDLPSPSAFTLDPLPSFVTGVRWIAVRNRSYLSQGAGKLQVSFDVNGTADVGADRALTTAVTYAADAFEEDPSTNSALTPLSITNSKIFLDRTE